MKSKVIKESYLYGASLMILETLDDFVASNETQALVNFEGRHHLCVKMKSNLENIDEFIYSVKNNSSTRGQYIVVNKKAYEVYEFGRANGLIYVLEKLMDTVRKGIEESFKSKNTKVLQLLEVDMNDDILKKNRVYSDCKYSDDEKVSYYKMKDTHEGCIEMLSGAIPFGILNISETNRESLIDEITKKVNHNCGLSFYKKVYDVCYDDTEIYSSFSTYVQYLSKKYLLWEDEYTHDMEEMKEECITKMLNQRVADNKTKYFKYEQYLGKKCSISYEDKKINATVQKIDYEKEFGKNVVILAKSSRKDYEISIDKINKIVISE